MITYFRYAIVFLLATSSSVFGQISSADSSACNSRTAQMLVEQQVTESKSVVERPKRVNILLRSADFLWPLDQAAARSYFVEAYKTAGEHFAEKGFERKLIAGDTRTFSTLPDLRTQVIKAVAKRDGDMAKRFANELLADFDKSNTERDGFDKNREQNDLLYLAAENAPTNPELARAIFRRVMSYPLTQTWLFALYHSSRGNQQFADGLYAEALQNYRGEIPSHLLYLSGYPFANPSSFGQGSSRFSASLPDGFAPNPALQRTFLEAFFARVASFSQNVDDYTRTPEKYESSEAVYMSTALSDIEPIVISRFPDLLQRFSVARSQADALLTDEMRKEMTTNKNRSEQVTATFDDRIKALEDAEAAGTLTDYMILQVLFNGRVKKDEQFQIYELWLGKIKEEKVRRDTSSYYWFLRCQLAIKEDRVSEAEKMAAKVPETEHRSILLFEMAKKQMEAHGDSAAAFDTLNGVSKITRSAPNSIAKLQILLGLVEFYDPINHSIALDELGEAIRVLNQLENPDIFQTWIYRQIVGKNFSFTSSYSLPGKSLEGTFTEMGKKDFELSLANARSLDDRYFRTLAVLAIAKNCVQTRESPVTKRAK